jgi:FkbM family methyltransferase
MSLGSYIQKAFYFIRNRYAPRGANICFTSTGEDLLIKQALRIFKISKPTYIDIGCHHPVFGNVTYLFYKNGSSGIVVEPNDSLCRIIRSKRNRDVCINAGVGKINGNAEFYKFIQDTRSTFSKNQADEWRKLSHQEYTTESIPLLSLDTIIDTHNNKKSPDLISIDTEGFEEEILSGFSWKYRPKIFCIESAGRKDSLILFFKSKNYAVYADTPANTIFIDIMSIQ